MGGDFASKGKQDCSKGIYVLAGLQPTLSYSETEVVPVVFAAIFMVHVLSLC